MFYHGRKKELIKYKNCHISPTEIEKVAMDHPDIIDIGVYGIQDEKVQGGFQLLDLIITELKSHMTC